MKRKPLTIFFICWSFYCVGMTNGDSLLVIWEDQSKSDTVRLSALKKIYFSDKMPLKEKDDPEFLSLETEQLENKKSSIEEANEIFSTVLANQIKFEKQLQASRSRIQWLTTSFYPYRKNSHNPFY